MTHQWASDDARQHYNIPFWGNGFFDVNAQGNMVVYPTRDQHNAVDLVALSSELQRQGIRLPALVRFPDILQRTLADLNAAFAGAITDSGYGNRYTAVYPIKVNQQRRVVDALLKAQQRYPEAEVGLEAGSKPELLAVLGMAPAGSVIVCNGYKDSEYLRAALIGEKLGHQVYIVVEKLTELTTLLAEAKALAVKPRIGVRIRLAAQGHGKWQGSGGEKSKFGLTASELLKFVNHLRAVGQLDCLELLHFHLGSQIANLRDIENGLRECARFFVELHRLGAPVQVVDVGGGLGVDYQGTRSRDDCSRNYSMRDYADRVVWAMQSACRAHDLPPPRLITESGRAMTAHHAVLITNVIGAEEKTGQTHEPASDSHRLVHNLHDLWQQAVHRADERAILEIYYDANNDLAVAQDLYSSGSLTLEERAHAEELYYAICRHVRERLSAHSRSHREVLDELNQKLALKLFVNLSIFQSLPDVWGINQIFPVLPLGDLHLPPVERAVLQDITCDSDGEIELYVDGQGVERTLPVPPYRDDRQNLFGFFLVGAYQEILGDMHNLFGDTDSVDVLIKTEGGYRITHHQHGDTVSHVLKLVNYEPQILLNKYREKFAATDLPESDKSALINELRHGLSGYTYLE